MDEFTGTQQKISKRDSSYLRLARWTIGDRTAFFGPVLLEYYQSLRARGKHHLTAIGAILKNMDLSMHRINEY